MPTAVQNLGAQLDAKRVALRQYLKDHESGDKERPYKAETDVLKIKADMAELDDLSIQYETQAQAEIAAKTCDQIGTELAKVHRPDFLMGGTQVVESKGLGDIVTGVLYKDGQLQKHKELEVKDFGALELKTTMTTAAGWGPVTIRSNKVVLSAQRPVIFMDILPTVPLTVGNVYEYMQETTFTNNAAVIAEAATYPESALAYTPVDANVRKVGTWIPVTEEQLSDVEGIRATVDNRLALMVMLAADNELLNGDGTGVHINGFYNQVTQTQAKATDPTFDAIFKAMILVRTVGFANPDAVVMHPLDFQDIRLTRTADGLYIMGNPDVVGSDRLFGLRTVLTTAATQNTGLVGDFGTFSAMITRWGMDIQATNSHDVNFIKDIWAIKARIRLGLAIYRLSAFCKVTGI